ncbi:heme exporter protein CcmB [Desulfovibrio sp. OttesenSCG-928-G15]|nr:heme exporter protein CcmB [Desulfovibrio sp. OttesenSCG-928-G15]
MLKAAFVIAAKDIRLTLGRGSGLVQAMLLGLLLIFIFSLSLAPGQRMTPEGAAAIFWMASAFCQVLIYSTLFASEEKNGQRQGLLLCPAPVQFIWLGKALAGLCMLFAAQCLFLPAIIVFLAQDITELWLHGLAILCVCDIGIAAVGSLLGALSQGQSAKESLLSIVVFPLLSPLLLGGIRVGSAVFSGVLSDGANTWYGIALAFDAIFCAAALALFPAVYSSDE